MKTIWKYELNSRNKKIKMPIGARILTTLEQNNIPCIWAEINTEAKTEEVIFEVFGTGHEMPVDPGTVREYIGTVSLYDGTLIFHVYKQMGVK